MGQTLSVMPDATQSESDFEYRSHNDLTSHQLADFRRCPLLYHQKKMGLIEEEDRPVYLVGRALHTLVLEGRRAFEEQYAVGGPINPKTGELYGSNTKAFAEWAAAQGRPVLTVQQHGLIECMVESIQEHKLAQTLLSEGVSESVVRAEYCQMPCQIRVDRFNPHRGIVDLKTCDDLDGFEWDIRRYGYVHQMAFYQAVLAVVIQNQVPVHLIAVEKREPFRCGVWQVSQTVLDQAERENAEAIERLRNCAIHNTWPTGYETKRVFSVL